MALFGIDIISPQAMKLSLLVHIFKFTKTKNSIKPNIFLKIIFRESNMFSSQNIFQKSFSGD